MEIYVLAVFVLGYFLITIEHTIKIDKLIPALCAMAFSWAIIALSINSFDTWFDPSTHSLVDGFGNLPLDDKTHLMEETLLHHLGKTAEILVFLIGAMTIGEIVDYYNGFSVFQKIIYF